MKSDNKQLEIKSTNQKSTKKENENKEYAKLVVVKPVGYPFEFNLMDENIEITNSKLFEEYAREQWLGLVVKEKSHLFDQKIIPDYGFEIITAQPNNSIIAETTKIKVIIDEVKNKTKPNIISSNIHLSDIIGQENAKSKVKVITKYLENPQDFGQWAPKNVLFYGLPGTGKTMLVKALANELEVQLYLIKATSLIGDHVGDSAATNNPTSLDYAVRSRFEEEIEFELPNDNERLQIIENNLKTMPLDYNLDLLKIVKSTKGLSGRDIKEKILKTALHNAIANDSEIITMSNINYAIESSKIKNTDIKGMFE